MAPYIYEGGINFKHKPYEAWVKLGGEVAPSHYPPKWLHGLAFRYELPTIVNCQLSIINSKREARLRFVEPVSLYFDTFPDYSLYEVIPFVWDCWPCYFEKMCCWLERHKVRTAIFTSSQTADMVRVRFPDMNILWCPEAIDPSCYVEGKQLKERSIDLLEFGRGGNLNVNYNETVFLNYQCVCTVQDGKFLYTNEELYKVMGDAKVAVALPRSITHPKTAGNIETLTQRYWECMLSRTVMIGHAPKELIDLIGYNPVVELDRDHVNEQLKDTLVHIVNYQELVDKNRETALQKGDWTIRMKDVMRWLQGLEYNIRKNDTKDIRYDKK